MNFGLPASGAGTRSGRPGRRCSSRRSRRCRATISTSAITNRAENTGPRVGSRKSGCLAFGLDTRLLLGDDPASGLISAGDHDASSQVAGYLSRRDPWIPREPPTTGPTRPRRRRRLWRIGTPLVVLLCGALFVVSAQTARAPTCARAATPTSPSLVSNEARDYRALQQRVTDLNAEVAGLTDPVNDTEVQRLPAADREAQGPGRAGAAHRARASR